MAEANNAPDVEAETQPQSQPLNINEDVQEAKKAAPRCTTVKDVAAAEFVKCYAAHLKRAGNIELPKTVDLWKTAPHKELSPYDADWFYTRVASMARKLYMKPGRGVGEFRKVYGGRKRRGSKPSHRGKASSGPLRKALQELEKLGVIEKDPNGGRKLTRKGRSEMDTQAAQCPSAAA